MSAEPVRDVRVPYGRDLTWEDLQAVPDDQYDVTPGRGRSYQPDVLVARREDVGEQRIEVAPLLVVEVLSPSSRALDRVLKREAYAGMGVPRYWIVDPDEPSLLALRLAEGVYAEEGRASGAELWTAQEPFPVTVVPARLLDE